MKGGAPAVNPAEGKDFDAKALRLAAANDFLGSNAGRSSQAGSTVLSNASLGRPLEAACSLFILQQEER